MKNINVVFYSAIIFVTLFISVFEFYLVDSFNRNSLYKLLQQNAESAYQNTLKVIDTDTHFDGQDDSYGLVNTIRILGNIQNIYTIKSENILESDFEYVLAAVNIDSGTEHTYREKVSGDILNTLSEQTVAIFIDKSFVYTVPVSDIDDKIIGYISIWYDMSDYVYAMEKTVIYTVLFACVTIIIVVLLSSYLFNKLSNPALKKLAYTDYLTGLKNRTAFELDLRSLNRSLSAVSKVCLIAFDLNELKSINDSFGHERGDMYIISAAEVFVKTFAEYGDIYRTGGDEFAVISTCEDEEIIKERINLLFALAAQANPPVRTSYGVAWYDSYLDNTLSDTFNRADAIMYQFKKANKAQNKKTLEVTV